MLLLVVSLFLYIPPYILFVVHAILLSSTSWNGFEVRRVRMVRES